MSDSLRSKAQNPLDDGSMDRLLRNFYQAEMSQAFRGEAAVDHAVVNSAAVSAVPSLVQPAGPGAARPDSAARRLVVAIAVAALAACLLMIASTSFDGSAARFDGSAAGGFAGQSKGESGLAATGSGNSASGSKKSAAADSPIVGAPAGGLNPLQDTGELMPVSRNGGQSQVPISDDGTTLQEIDGVEINPLPR